MIIRHLKNSEAAIFFWKTFEYTGVLVPKSLGLFKQATLSFLTTTFESTL